MASTRSVGSKAELVVVRYLINLGYRVHRLNFFTVYGEIDIIAQKGNQLFFLEVKSFTPKNSHFKYQVVSKSKLLRLTRTIGIWLERNRVELDWQLDLILVERISNRFIITHLPNI